MTNLSSAYLRHSLGVSGSTYSFLLEVFHVKVSHYGANRGPNSSSLHLLEELALEGKVCIMQAELSLKDYVLDW